MAKWQLGYKVILKDGRVSCIVGHNEYKKLTVTKPVKGYGPLCVFVDEKSARAFKQSHYFDEVKIVPCVFVRSKETKIWEIGRKGYAVKIRRLPKGTVLASQVICLE